ncbi:hypothetical protein [Pseudoalteromonas xiamenensis]|uniref:Uncharacterized protein n=1 Tax=Pseudoalteromonas xiamenensis TaxID=882626 RepID=A0A975HKE9_9GAMM|nr:hypothetical protein [Pseudoalteromonas xiamenensis]QTH70958.1 hypothetical protein J5O05_13905 [Pseudoalteromonas xiamenensis]
MQVTLIETKSGIEFQTTSYSGNEKDLFEASLLTDEFLSKYGQPDVVVSTDCLESVMRDNRKRAYLKESDPLYMEWQFDQTDEAKQRWLAKVAEIKTRYPFPIL